MLLLLAACFQDPAPFVSTSGGLQASDLCNDTPSGSVVFPTDAASHSEALERWRWQARLSDGTTDYFTQVEATWISEMTWQVYQSLAIPSTGAFQSSVTMFSGAEPGNDGLALELLGLTAMGGMGADAVMVETEDWDVYLDFNKGKAPMLYGGSGDLTFEEGFARGYAWNRMAVSASLLTADNTMGEPVELTGQGSMEHSWGNFANVEAQGWVRFSLQLADGRDLSVFYVPGQENPVANATLSDALCWVSDVTPSVTVTPGDEWTSTGSACSWPTTWKIDIDSESFEVDARMRNQEISSADLQVWSGEVSLSDSGFGTVVATGCF